MIESEELLVAMLELSEDAATPDVEVERPSVNKDDVEMSDDASKLVDDGAISEVESEAEVDEPEIGDDALVDDGIISEVESESVVVVLEMIDDALEILDSTVAAELNNERLERTLDISDVAEKKLEVNGEAEAEESDMLDEVSDIILLDDESTRSEDALEVSLMVEAGTIEVEDMLDNILEAEDE